MVLKYRKCYELKSLLNTGAPPIMMKRVQGDFVLETSNNKPAVVIAVILDGTYASLKVIIRLVASNKHAISFPLGLLYTP